MGWKNVKEHYDIKHIVQVRNGVLHIGSPYIHNLLNIDIATGNIKWGTLGGGNNENLARYYQEMKESPATLRDLLQTPDTFAASHTVYTWDGSEIIEKQCEEVGWPHCTHDGQIMYENTFSTDKEEVISWAIVGATSEVTWTARRVEELQTELDEAEARRKIAQGDLAKLLAIRAAEGAAHE